MTATEISAVIKKLDDHCSRLPWLDIDVAECSPTRLRLLAGIDLSMPPTIELNFESIFFTSLLMSWKTDTARPVLHVLTDQDAIRINMQYGIERGYHLFAFDPEDLGKDVRCVIAAKEFSWRLLQ